MLCAVLGPCVGRRREYASGVEVRFAIALECHRVAVDLYHYPFQVHNRPLVTNATAVVFGMHARVLRLRGTVRTNSKLGLVS